MTWWEAHRDSEKRTFRQWLVGLPAGLLLGIAIFLNFSSGWNKQAAYVANASFNPVVLIIATLVIITFVAIFSKRYKWEVNEQKYRELKEKESKEAN